MGLREGVIKLREDLEFGIQMRLKMHPPMLDVTARNVVHELDILLKEDSAPPLLEELRAVKATYDLELVAAVPKVKALISEKMRNAVREGSGTCSFRTAGVTKDYFSPISLREILGWATANGLIIDAAPAVPRGNGHDVTICWEEFYL
jgi:hypothetical protein